VNKEVFIYVLADTICSVLGEAERPRG